MQSKRRKTEEKKRREKKRKGDINWEIDIKRGKG